MGKTTATNKKSVAELRQEFKKTFDAYLAFQAEKRTMQSSPDIIRVTLDPELHRQIIARAQNSQ